MSKDMLGKKIYYNGIRYMVMLTPVAGVRDFYELHPVKGGEVLRVCEL